MLILLYQITAVVLTMQVDELL